MHKDEPRWIVTPSDKKLNLPFLRGIPVKVFEN